MTSFPILDLVLGMTFIYLLFSVITSSVVEVIGAVVKLRARFLEEWLKKVFDKQALDENGNPAVDASGNKISLGQSIMDHCIANALTRAGKSTSYISAQNFVSALLDKVSLSQTGAVAGVPQPVPTTVGHYVALINASPVVSNEIKRTMIAIAQEAQNAEAFVKANPTLSSALGNVKSELEHFREKLEHWYDTMADRLGGHYKRRILRYTAVISFLVVMFSNADSIELAQYFYKNPQANAQFASLAATYSKNAETLRRGVPSDTATQQEYLESIEHNMDKIDATLKLLNENRLPLFWTKQEITKLMTEEKMNDWNYGFWASKITGLLLTFFAVLMGAPFWFDMLNKIANLRSTGPKPASSADVDRKLSGTDKK